MLGILAIGPAARVYTTMTQPRLETRYWEDLPQYTVYDQFGRIMVRTSSLAVARGFLELADRGISAGLYGLLERWRWRIPRSIIDQIPAPLPKKEVDTGQK